MRMNRYNFLKGANDIWRIEELNPVTFIHADNISFLRKCKEEMMFKYFHVGIVDPPYGIDVTKMNMGATKNSKPKSYKMGDWDGEVPVQEYWDLLWYCCRNLIIWGGNYFTHSYGQTGWDGISNPIIAGRCFGLWDKGNDKMSFAFGELAITTFDRNPFRILKSRNSKTEEDGEDRHRTQKPVYLYDYLHINFVERNQRVLDTHGGSFSHAIAAQKNNVDLTIIEKEESYIISGIEEYENGMKKPRLLF